MFHHFYRQHGKRWLDLLIVTGSLPLVLPLCLLLSLLAWLNQGIPVLFCQERPGQDERTFTLYKFRTMRNTCDQNGRILPDEQRVTKFGTWLRRLSLDELPELMNVLKGDMSLIGPRPLLVRYLPYFTPQERQRFSVRPGITGWAQVNGRNDLPWNERFAHDIWYVENLSLWLDLKILWLTFCAVWQRQNINVVPHLSMSDLDDERETAVAAPLQDIEPVAPQK